MFKQREQSYVFEVEDNFLIMLYRDTDGLYPSVGFYIKQTTGPDWVHCFGLVEEKGLYSLINSQKLDWQNQQHIEVLLNHFISYNLNYAKHFYSIYRQEKENYEMIHDLVTKS